MKQTLEFKLGQQLALTPEMRQSIRYLQMPSLELEQAVRDLLDQNVMLEEGSFDADVDSDTLAAEAELESRLDMQAPASGARPDDAYAGLAAAEQSLAEYLCWQLELSSLPDNVRLAAEALVHELDDDGYLRIDFAEFARLCSVSDVTLATAHAALLRLDPVGIGARNLAECLRVQLLENHAGNALLPQALELATRPENWLARATPAVVARELRCDTDMAAGALDIVRHQQPKPGEAWLSVVADTVVPDVVARPIENRWAISSTRSRRFPLRINNDYAALVSSHAECRAHAGLRGQLAEARFVLRAIQMREDTIVRVTRAIMARQRAFFERGHEGLVPLTLREIAEDTGLHESTISRVVNGKYLQAPNGTWELRFFFSAQVKTQDGFGAAAATVKARIRSIVKGEKGKPLSDTAITRALAAEGIQIARRTVAKYREQQGIPSVTERARLLAVS